MPRQPIVHLTDTTLAIVDFERFQTEKPAFEALMAWCRDHNIDPDRVPADGIIEVFPDAQIIHHGYRPKETRSTETMQVVHDKPIAPWPDEIIALAKIYGGRDTELENAMAEIERLNAEVAGLRQNLRDAAAIVRPAKETR